jgi:hypothetical protein
MQLILVIQKINAFKNYGFVVIFAAPTAEIDRFHCHCVEEKSDISKDT